MDNSELTKIHFKRAVEAEKYARAGNCEQRWLDAIEAWSLWHKTRGYESWIIPFKIEVWRCQDQLVRLQAKLAKPPPCQVCSSSSSYARWVQGKLVSARCHKHLTRS